MQSYPLAWGALLAAIAFVVASVFFAHFLTRPRRRTLETEPALPPYEKIDFRTDDNVRLSGWFVPCGETKRAVVLLHGYSDTRAQVLARARWFHDHGYAALLYDARGHGESGGNLVSYGWHETQDLLAAVSYVRERGLTEIGCLGISQGGATIALAAAKLTDIRWVVLESVFPTLSNAVDRRFRRYLGLPSWPASTLMQRLAEMRWGVTAATIAPRDHVHALRCPVFVMIGDRDRNTRLDDARELFDRAREPKAWWVVPDAAHVDLYGVAKAAYEERLLRFLETGK
jgi:uncharacterized protein